MRSSNKFTINNVEDIKRIKEGDFSLENVVKVLFKVDEHTISSINNLSIFELKGSIINN